MLRRTGSSHKSTESILGRKRVFTVGITGKKVHFRLGVDREASVVIAMAVSVCHKSVFGRNAWTDQTGF